MRAAPPRRLLPRRPQPLPPRATPAIVPPARRDDAPTLVAFNAALARETEELDLHLPTLAAGVDAVLADATKGAYYIAELPGVRDGPAAACLVTYEWSDWRAARVHWLQSVYTAPDARGQGAFTALYDHVRAAAAADGGAGVRLYVDDGNAAAAAVYRARGMTSHYRVMEDLF